VIAVMSGVPMPAVIPASRWIFFTAETLSGVTKLMTTPSAPARAVRPDRWT
jgi:hypothetical protein